MFGSLVKQYALGPDRRPGRLADRRRPARRRHQRRGAALDEGAGHRLRRPAARRQGPAAGAHGRLRATPPTTTAGVHINSGIPNHAFYLAATALGGNSLGEGRADLVRHPHRRRRCARPPPSGSSRPHGEDRREPVRIRGAAGGDGGVDAGGRRGRVTRIIVTRTGGFAGITRTTEVSDPDAVDRILVTLRDRPDRGRSPATGRLRVRVHGRERGGDGRDLLGPGIRRCRRPCALCCADGPTAAAVRPFQPLGDK